jgi:hypothetical protein
VGSEIIIPVAEKHVLLKLADSVCTQMATAVGIPQRCKEEKLEDTDRKERERETKRERSIILV